eukprot:2795795-Rhodomonas_salina.1
MAPRAAPVGAGGAPPARSLSARTLLLSGCTLLSSDCTLSEDAHSETSAKSTCANPSLSICTRACTRTLTSRDCFALGTCTHIH